MRITKVFATNFQSYKKLEFDYSNCGLTLFSGPTGAGKSTVLDLCSWVLFGQTSKEGSVDDVKPWSMELYQDWTFGRLTIEVNQEHMDIVRIRGLPKENDLFIQKKDEEIRGKDLKDTQKLIENIIDIDFDLFILSSYLHQFSKADQFFITKAKERREIFEQISDLSLPIKLSERSAENRKIQKQKIQDIEKDLHGFKTSLMIYSDQRKKLSKSFDTWEEDKKNNLKTLQDKSDNFEEDRKKEISDLVEKVTYLHDKVVSEENIEKNKISIKAQIKALHQVKEDHKVQFKLTTELKQNFSSLKKRYDDFLNIGEYCPMCLNKAHNNNLHEEINKIKSELFDVEEQLNREKIKLASLDVGVSCEDSILKSYDNLRETEILNSKMLSDLDNYKNRLEILRNIKNSHNEKIIDIMDQVNPFMSQLVEIDNKIDLAQQSIQISEENTKSCQELISYYTWIYDKSFEVRGLLLDQARQEIQNKTNELLSSYFDGTLSIQLEFQDSDKLHLDIQNNGYNAPYKQLSGGERCILRLCFYLALSEKIQENKGFDINFIMLDEALNGLNPTLKTKAFRLLESLTNKYESVFVVDHHEEFQELFNNKYLITNEDGISSLNAY